MFPTVWHLPRTLIECNVKKEEYYKIIDQKNLQIGMVEIGMQASNVGGTGLLGCALAMLG